MLPWRARREIQRLVASELDLTEAVTAGTDPADAPVIGQAQISDSVSAAAGKQKRGNPLFYWEFSRFEWWALLDSDQ